MILFHLKLIDKHLFVNRQSFKRNYWRFRRNYRANMGIKQFCLSQQKICVAFKYNRSKKTCVNLNKIFKFLNLVRANASAFADTKQFKINNLAFLPNPRFRACVELFHIDPTTLLKTFPITCGYSK